MKEVEDQYTKWVYPIPIEDMRASIADRSYIEIGDPLLWWPVYWPKRRDPNNLDVLIAGCGTCQAAYYACRNPSWNILGIDISASSLGHQKKLKERHNLSNLRLEKISLTEIGKLGETFDFITSTGVLHHLPDPDAGLLALTNVLRPEGVMNLMVYGKSLRLGVYLMQEVFRTLNFGQTQEDVDIVKTTIQSLDKNHVVKKYVDAADDLHYDAAIVDTFLHPQDRAYSVKEIFEFTRKSGLEFLSWADPLPYSLRAAVPSKHPLWKKLNNLSLEIQAHVCDLLVQERGTHRWAAAHPDYVKKVTIPFDRDEFFDCFACLNNNVKILKPGSILENMPTYLQRHDKEFQIDATVSAILERINSETNIRTAIQSLNLPPRGRDEIKIRTKNTLQRLWEQGHIYILLP